MDELEKDIAAYLKDYDYILEHLKKRGPIGQHEEALYLLTRCLDAISWRSVEEPPEESGDYLCKVMDSRDEYPDEWFEVTTYLKRQAFPSLWETTDFDTVVEWRPITPKGEE